MARPIKETPILRGQDAVNFLNKINSTSRPKMSQEERERIQRNYKALKDIAKF